MELDWSVHVQPFPGAPRGGDTGIVIPLDGGALAVLVDASGHGLSAYFIAQKIRAYILGNSLYEPDLLLQELDRELKGTDGAAISIARIKGTQISFAGIGNVQVKVADRPLFVRNGIVGVRMHQPKLVQTQLERDQWLLMHTDGVNSPDILIGSSANIIARSIIKEFASKADDAAVLLLRWREKSN